MNMWKKKMASEEFSHWLMRPHHPLKNHFQFSRASPQKQLDNACGDLFMNWSSEMQNLGPLYIAFWGCSSVHNTMFSGLFCKTENDFSEQAAIDTSPTKEQVLIT